MKKIIYVLGALTLLLGAYYLYMYWALGNDSVAQQNTHENEMTIEPEYPAGLEAEVYKTVDAKSDGVWDERLVLDEIENSQKAVKGKWYANDAWSWISWQRSDGQWEVLVSLDGFDCEELTRVPSAYSEFFYDRTHLNDEQYCYSHE